MKITGKARQALLRAWTSTAIGAYIFPDGIMVTERKDVLVKVAGKSVLTTHHIYYPTFGEVTFRAHNGNTPTRIVCHNPSVLLDGVSEINVYAGNKSQKMEAMNMECTTLTLTTDSGAHHRENIFPFISSDYVPQYHAESLASMVETVRKEREYILVEAA